MTGKKFLGIVLVILSCLLSPAVSFAQGSTLQISTNFRSVSGNPTWVLEVRDTETQLVVPYIFDIKQNDNYWVAFTFGHVYKVVSSELQFQSGKKFHNFCHLQNGVIRNKSMYITITGDLRGRPDSYKCIVKKYSN